MNQYTVILRRPPRLLFEDFPDHSAKEHEQDSYWALVEAEGLIQAVVKARHELARADNKDWRDHIVWFDLEMIQPEEYTLVAVLNGHHQPVLWGWQLLGD